MSNILSWFASNFWLITFICVGFYLLMSILENIFVKKSEKKNADKPSEKIEVQADDEAV